MATLTITVEEFATREELGHLFDNMTSAYHAWNISHTITDGSPAETFSVECTDGDATGDDRAIVFASPLYFSARDVFVSHATANPESRYILAVGTDTRTRMLSDSDTDNLVRVQRGLKAV